MKDNVTVEGSTTVVTGPTLGSRNQWVARGTGTPIDRDEVNRREVSECDG
jgi:hypothetical protein